MFKVTLVSITSEHSHLEAQMTPNKKKVTQPVAKKKTTAKKKKAGSRIRKPSKRWHANFLDALKRTRNIGQACQVAGVGRRTAYTHRSLFEDFALAWDEAFQTCIDDLEASAFKRAIEGHKKAVYFQGVYCGDVVTYETALTIFMMKCHKPERYNIDVRVNEPLTADETAKAVRDAIGAMRATVPSDGE